MIDEVYPPIILIGKSGSGKDTTANYLVSNYPFNRVLEYTTRDKRPGERDDVEYHFISDDKFDSMRINNDFITQTRFDRFQDGIKTVVKYGIKKSDINDNSIIVTNPHNMVEIKKHIPEVLVVYINVPFIFREVRLQKRGDSDMEIMRRSKADEADFSPDVTDMVDICVFNTNSLKTPAELSVGILKRITDLQIRRFNKRMVLHV